jgi:UDP-glucose 6-dehydrogenase
VGVYFEILKAAERVNKQRIDRFLGKVHQALSVVKGTRVAIPQSSIHFRLQGRD